MARSKSPTKPVLVNSPRKIDVTDQSVINNRLTVKKADMKIINPMTANQELIFDEYEKEKCLFLHGFPGTGKTFISMALSLEQILSGTSKYEKLYVVRSAVPSRDSGFLPGTLEEKNAIYELPYKAICSELFPAIKDPYQRLVEQRKIEFITTSYLRGVTYKNCIIVVDEVQNFSFSELDTIISRAGKFSKIIFSGDFRQTDLSKDKDRSGLHDFMKVCRTMKEFSFIELEVDDIVRSGLVKNYIIAKSRMGLL